MNQTANLSDSTQGIQQYQHHHQQQQQQQSGCPTAISSSASAASASSASSTTTTTNNNNNIPTRLSYSASASLSSSLPSASVNSRPSLMRTYSASRASSVMSTEAHRSTPSSRRSSFVAMAQGMESVPQNELNSIQRPSSLSTPTLTSGRGSVYQPSLTRPSTYLQHSSSSDSKQLVPSTTAIEIDEQEQMTFENFLFDVNEIDNLDFDQLRTDTSSLSAAAAPPPPPSTLTLPPPFPLPTSTSTPTISPIGSSSSIPPLSSIPTTAATAAATTTTLTSRLSQGVVSKTTTPIGEEEAGEDDGSEFMIMKGTLIEAMWSNLKISNEELTTLLTKMMVAIHTNKENCKECEEQSTMYALMIACRHPCKSVCSIALQVRIMMVVVNDDGDSQ